MKMKKIVTAVMVSCTAVVMSAVPGLAAQAPQQPQRATADTAKPSSDMAAKSKTC